MLPLHVYLWKTLDDNITKFPMDEKFCVDEQVIHFKGRQPHRVYQEQAKDMGL
jgi:hypothetical protein